MKNSPKIQLVFIKFICLQVVKSFEFPAELKKDYTSACQNFKYQAYHFFKKTAFSKLKNLIHNGIKAKMGRKKLEGKIRVVKFCYNR